MAYVLHQLLTESAARRPDAEAVRLLNEAITYRELETRSNQLAHALIKSGVTPVIGSEFIFRSHQPPSSAYLEFSKPAPAMFRSMQTRLDRACWKLRGNASSAR